MRTDPHADATFEKEVQALIAEGYSALIGSTERSDIFLETRLLYEKAEELSRLLHRVKSVDKMEELIGLSAKLRGKANRLQGEARQ